MVLEEALSPRKRGVVASMAGTAVRVVAQALQPLALWNDSVKR